MQMIQAVEAVKILQKHHIPFQRSEENETLAVLQKNEVDLEQLRRLGFRISHLIGDQVVVFYKGGRFGLVV